MHMHQRQGSTATQGRITDLSRPSLRSLGLRPIDTFSRNRESSFPALDHQSLGSAIPWLENSDLSYDDSPHNLPGLDRSGSATKMVKERSPTRTSSNQPLSPQKAPPRQPLANISAKMQSQSPRQQGTESVGEKGSLSPLAPVEFGKASPLRNPLKKETSIFIPRAKPSNRPSPPQARPHMDQATQENQFNAAPVPATADRGFYLPKTGLAQVPTMQIARPFTNDSYKRSAEIAVPQNSIPPTRQPQPRPTISSLAPATQRPAFAPPRPIIDLTRIADDDDEDAFDPDAAIRADSGKFGESDPYMYIDSTQANSNIKDLLEGAFDDDEDKSRTRLRRRAKKAAQSGDSGVARSLANKLAALSVAAQSESTEKSTTGSQEQEDEEEDGTVDGLAVKLLPHQVEGVSWMIDKEIGMRKRNGVLPHGGILADDMGLGKTVQSVALILTNSRPAADAKPEHPKQKLPGKEVGKGTLVVAPLALIKQWEDEIKTKVSKTHALRVLVHHGPSRTKSAVELKKYDVVITTYQTLTSEHAGSNMGAADGARLGCFGVHWYRLILDEAHSIKNRGAKSTLACCALNSWYRWCLTGTPMQNNLDELQSLIKFLRIKPYCDVSQWKSAITGPMKNGRGGLAMRRLQYFLKAFMKRRTKDILKQDGALSFGGKAQNAGEVKKPGMQIVKREVITLECEFDDQEQAFYTRLQERADRRLKEMTREGAKGDYIGALVLLLRLRQVCDHPQLIENAMNKDNDAMTTGLGNTAGSQTPRKQSRVDDGEMDALAALMGGVSVQSKNCDVCQVALSTNEAKNGAVRCEECEADLASMRGKPSLTKKHKSAPRRARHRLADDSDDEGEGEWIGQGPEQYGHYGKAGGTDDEDAKGGGETLNSIESVRSEDDDDDAEDSPPRAMRTQPPMRKKHIVDDETDDEETKSSDSDTSSDRALPSAAHRATSHKHKPSTKIRQLLRILHAETPNHKTIVFSQFTTMLDLIQPHLDKAGLRYVRYDGSMRNDAREAALHSLRTNTKTRVLLCSLKCGSLGLNLTAASRVVIVEPFWNPFVEEQAIDRVHRLNQTVDVKVFRLTIRNTVEERILALQERKRELAKAAIEGGKAVGKLSMKDILSLFQRDAEHGAHDEEDRKLWQKFGGDQRLLDGADARSEAARSNLGVTSERSQRPGKARAFQEHEVYGRRW